MNIEQLHAITGSSKFAIRKASLLSRLRDYDLLSPHIAAQIMAQVLHESAAFQYVEEIASGAAYEGRKDLGNTQAGDGRRYKGRDLIQCTGRTNYRLLMRWVRTTIGANVDFEKTPQALIEPKWIGIGVAWYFLTRDGLMRYCEAGDIEMVTRRVNGGLNGYADRLEWYDRTALVLLGYGRGDVRGFQEANGLTVDGISGPKTRASMHAGLKALRPAPQSEKSPFAAILAALAAIFGGKA